MRSPYLALLYMGTAAICGAAAICGTAVFCQSPEPKKVDPDKLFQMPGKFAQPGPDLGKPRLQPFLWNKLIPGHPTILGPRPEWKNPQIDPKIIIHPPWHGQSKGRDFAHHLYPDLKFLPLERGPQMPR